MNMILSKGRSIALDSSVFDLSSITIGCGWDARPSLASRLFGGEESIDLDIVAFALCGGRLVETGDERMVGSDVCFFNNPEIADGNIVLSDDDRTGANSEEGDDEQITIWLELLDEAYDRVVFLVQIYEAAERGQDFSRVANAYVRALDAQQREIVRFHLTDAGRARSVVFAEISRGDDRTWVFRAIGESSRADSFADYIEDFIYGRR